MHRGQRPQMARHCRVAWLGLGLGLGLGLELELELGLDCRAPHPSSTRGART